MADVEEIQEYLWEDLIFHNYSLTKKKQQKDIFVSTPPQDAETKLLNELGQQTEKTNSLPAGRAPGRASSAPEL